MDFTKIIEKRIVQLKTEQGNRLYLRNLEQLKNEFEIQYEGIKSILQLTQSYEEFFADFQRIIRGKYVFMLDDYEDHEDVKIPDPLDGTWLKSASIAEKFNTDRAFINAAPMTRWGRFLYYLRSEKKFSLETVDNIARSSLDVIARCHDPNSPSDQFYKGMVVGSVQSGKTTNFNAVINAAYDIGINMVIVLTGITEDLRTQTQARLNTDLGICEHNKGVNIILGDDSIGVRSIKTLTSLNEDFNIATIDGGVNIGNQLSLIVTKKNNSTLLNIYRFLRDKISEGAIDVKAFNLIVVDDEADNATLNGVGHRRLDSDATAINGLIRGILELFKRKTYVAYTATPFANILQDANLEGTWKYANRGEIYEIPLSTNLFPEKFVRLLDPPANYIGPRYFFDFDPTIQNNFEFLINEIFDTEDHFPERFDQNIPVKLFVDKEEFDRATDLKELYGDFGAYRKDTRSPRVSDHKNINSIPHSLKDAILCFILTIAIRKIRAGIYPELHKMQPHNTMLIHISRFSDWQIKVKSLISNDNKKGYLDQVFKDLGMHNKGEGIYLDFERVWNFYYSDIVGNLNGVMENHYYDPYIQKHELNDIFSILPSIARDGIDVLSINTNCPDDNLNYTNDDGKNYIAIGGNRLSRGFTLEGLSISYFTRSTGYADAILQMGRWFGYRPGYLDCCRLFTDRHSYKKFEECVLILDDLERDIKQHMADPASYPKKIVNRIRATSGQFIKITRPNILRNSELAYYSFSDKLLQTYRYDLEKENHQISWDNYIAFFDKYSSQLQDCSGENNSKKLTVTNFDIVKELIDTSLIINKAFDKERLFNFIDEQRKMNGFLKTWDIVFVNGSEQRGKGKVVEVGNYKFKSIIRSGPEKGSEKKNSKLYQQLLDEGYYSIKNAMVISPKDMSLALSAEKQHEIFEANKTKATIPEFKFREAYGKYRGVVLVYLIDSAGVFTTDESKNKLGLDTTTPIAAFAVGIPDLEVEPQVYHLMQREYIDADIADENGEEQEERA
ncbi:Z1 domain-containing protein [Sphingobacterium sp. UME9]|uniref:Z1 domain-containing protein n=1 Tax=Sphingobacterium sp. UME9 TaxID=1862316 RepID=UPI001600269A|nr:Z1 domain-containing protein [Sphingobacterium sp. UME9]MBB1643054.1 hypothetical protein [Sphingobacterium sp. UME9]